LVAAACKFQITLLQGLFCIGKRNETAQKIHFVHPTLACKAYIDSPGGLISIFLHGKENRYLMLCYICLMLYLQNRYLMLCYKKFHFWKPMKQASFSSTVDSAWGQGYITGNTEDSSVTYSAV